MKNYKTFFLLVLSATGANLLGVVYNMVVIRRLMLGLLIESSIEFQKYMTANYRLSLIYNIIVFPLIIFFFWHYFKPVQMLMNRKTGDHETVNTRLARKRAINFPLAIGLLAAVPWLLSVPVMASLLYFIEHIRPRIFYLLNLPLVGIVSAIATYLILDALFRIHIAPVIFPHGRLRTVPGAIHISLLSKMILLAVAICLIPIVSNFGFIQAARMQIKFGIDSSLIMQDLYHNTRFLMLVFIVAGLTLAWFFARSFSRPLIEMEKMAYRIEHEDYSSSVRIVSNDEVGVLGDSMNAMIRGLRDRARILAEFGRMVDPDVRDYILSDASRITGRKKEVIILFSDIRSFTSISERLPPETIFRLLNLHFTNLTANISKHGGHVDKFIGDAIMAVFGLFDDDPLDLHARRALDACLEIRAGMESFNISAKEEKSQALRIGMGLHAGEVLAGQIGSKNRHEYTIIGDPVNVAARIESACKEFEVDLLVSDEVFRLCASGSVSAGSMKINIEGRSEPLVVHRVRSESAQIP